MKTISSKDIKRKAWVEVTEGWHIRLKNIPETWALGYALHRYFHSISPSSWPMNYNFLRLDCINCNQTTIYAEAFDIKDTYSEEGQVGCPHCQYPWLTFSYDLESRERIVEIPEY